MKKGILIMIMWSLGNVLMAQDDKVLMTIEDKPVYLSEFTYIYEKNNGESADYSQESVDEYLDLFTNFKLKVEKARELKLDTISSLKDELAGYRKQLANSYLMEKELSERLIQEMWDRRQSDVHIAHILFKLRKNPGHEEINDALARAQKIKDRIDSGESFEALAAEKSEDASSSKSGGSLGYITAWLPTGFYPLENAAYNLDIGNVSDPIITKLGVHLVKVLDKRPAFGKIEVAHILMRKPEQPSNKNIKAKIDVIYQLIQEGNDFEALAEEFSEDKTSANRGGRLNAFGINTFERAFEKVAFSLEKDGDISKPVETRIGWHIIKRISKPVESFEEFRTRMKPMLGKMDRYEHIQNRLVEEIKEETNYKVDDSLLSSFASAIDSTFLTYKWRIPEGTSTSTFMSLGPDYTYSLKDFAQYARLNARMRMRFSREKTPQQAVMAIYDSFVKEKAMLYEEKNLERKYPDFKALMREYEEGILLFEVSKMEVWDKASQDTAGLRKFFDANWKNYYEPLKADVATYYFSTEQKGNVNAVYAHARDHTPQETLDKFNSRYTAVEVIVSEITQGSEDIGIEKFENGKLGKMMKREDGNVTFSKIIKVKPLEYRSLDDSKGYVIADYQQYLEEKWIELLKQEFNVKFKDEVLNNLVK